ncbi:hypothetical protein QNM99_22250 [Pseudomonas sp. PCH446]
MAAGPDGPAADAALAHGRLSQMGRGRRAARQDWLTRTLQARLSPEEQNKLAQAVELLRRLVDD